MNKQKMQIHAQAAHELSDEIGAAMRKSELAHHIMGDIFADLLESDDLKEASEADLRMSYESISWRVEVLAKYLCEIKSDLTALVELGYDAVPVKAKTC